MLYQPQQFAGFWRRYFALLVDGFIEFAALLILSFGLGPRGVVLWMMVVIAYDIGFHHKFGATLGQQAMGIRLVSVDGAPLTVGQCLGRFFARILSGIPLNYGFIRSVWDDQRQAWHDELAGTYVIRTGVIVTQPVVPVQLTAADREYRVKRRRIVALSVFLGICLSTLITQIALRYSEVHNAARDAIACDTVVNELVGGVREVAFRFGNPLALAPDLLEGHVYFNVTGDSGSAKVRAKVYHVVKGGTVFKSWIDIEHGPYGYQVNSYVGTFLSMQRAQQGNQYLSKGDSLSAHQLFGRALALNNDYKTAKQTRQNIGADSTQAVQYLEWETNRLNWTTEAVFPAGYDPSETDREAGKSWLIHSRLVRAHCFVVVHDLPAALADIDSLLAVFPWVYPAYFDKASIFGGLGSKDSSEYYIDSFLAAETDTTSHGYKLALWLRSKLTTQP